MKASKPALAAAAICMIVLILDSKSAARAAYTGVDLCIRTVIPSLFPFFLISGYLTGNLHGGKWIAKLFRCPESCGSILLTGFLGGYPIGAGLTAREYRAGNISKAQADRLLMFCSQAGPSFLFGIVAGQLENAHHIWILWGIQTCSALSVAWLVPGENSMVHVSHCDSVSMTEAMKKAIEAISSVCGWIIMFSVLISFLKRWVIWILPESAQVFLFGALELTSGCLMLSALDSPQLRFLLAALILNFGGLCVLMQTASVAAGLSLKRYIEGKILQSMFCVMYALAVIGYPTAVIPVFCVFAFRKSQISRKNSSISARIGV